ncbi:MAG: hypothetical protein J6A03_06380 [Lachnospiraceae bacterium]|nr:hypothetical protein [Lachnospiraceae bacterium]
MVDQQTFMDTIASVAEIMRTAEIPMTEQEILSYFADMELSDAQKARVMDYLKNPEMVADTTEENTRDTTEEDIPNSKVYQMYLEDLAGIPQYEEEEKITLYKALLAGDEKAIEPISMFSLKKVLQIADKYMEPKLLVEDLVQEGNVALFMKLSELCGCEKSYDVEEELERAIEQAIVNYAAEIDNESEQERSLVGKLSLVYEAKKLLTEENGAEPTIEELAEYTKMDVEELQELEDFVKENEKK